MTGFIFSGSKITADGGWSHEIKMCLLFGRKAMTNLDSVLKSRDITFPTKVHLVEAMEKTVESPLDCKGIKPLNPKGNQPCIFWSSNILATWWEELIHWKRPWCWESLKEGGEGDDRGWDGWMESLTQWMWIWASSGSWVGWWIGKPGLLQFIGLQSVRHDWTTEVNWTELMVFPVVTYRSESWTTQKAELRRTDVFEFWW